MNVVLAFFIFGGSISLISSSTFVCDTTNPCIGDTLQCLDNEDCYLSCQADDDSVCDEIKFICPNNELYNCSIDYRGSSDKGGSNSEVECKNTKSFYMFANTRGLEGNFYCQDAGDMYFKTGAEALVGITVYCPFDANCTFYAGGQSSFEDITVYAQNSSNVQFHAHHDNVFGGTKVFCPHYSTTGTGECLFTGPEDGFGRMKIYAEKGFGGITANNDALVNDGYKWNGGIMNCGENGYEYSCDIVKIEVNDTYQLACKSDTPICDYYDPSPYPTLQPTQPTSIPSNSPTQPTALPSNIPSYTPTQPTNKPSLMPTGHPSRIPSYVPSSNPTNQPSTIPTGQPTSLPTQTPSVRPTIQPSAYPSQIPSDSPSLIPTNIPTFVPSEMPTFFNNEYNNTAILEINIVSGVINVSLVLNDVLTWKAIISELISASIAVRFDIEDGDDIDVSIIEVDNVGKMNERRRILSENEIKIVFEVGLSSNNALQDWINDIEFIVNQFETNMKENDYVNDPNIDVKYVSVETASNQGVKEDKNDNNNQDFDVNLNVISYSTIIGVAVISLIIAVLGKIHAKRVVHNERFKMTTIGTTAIIAMDVISDLFFIMQIYQTIAQKGASTILVVIWIGSMVFLVLPILGNYIQLHRAIQVWVTDIETKRVVQAWIQMHLRSLYMICILLGSAFSAVEVCNSNLFSLSLFDMGLNRRQKAIFKNQRLLSTVCLENIPQLIIQLIYSFETGIAPVTIFASLFSILSVTLSVFEYISSSVLLKTETVLIIKISVVSNELSELPRKLLRKIQSHRRIVTQEIAKIIDIDERLIELLTPSQTTDGIDLTFHIRSDVTHGPIIMTLLKTQVKSGYLATVLRRSWCSLGSIELKYGTLSIGNIETKELKPETNLEGFASDHAAVISLNNNNNTHHHYTQKTASMELPSINEIQTRVATASVSESGKASREQSGQYIQSTESLSQTSGNVIIGATNFDENDEQGYEQGDEQHDEQGVTNYKFNRGDEGDNVTRYHNNNEMISLYEEPPLSAGGIGGGINNASVTIMGGSDIGDNNDTDNINNNNNNNTNDIDLPKKTNFINNDSDYSNDSNEDDNNNNNKSTNGNTLNIGEGINNNEVNNQESTGVEGEGN